MNYFFYDTSSNPSISQKNISTKRLRAEVVAEEAIHASKISGCCFSLGLSNGSLFLFKMTQVVWVLKHIPLFFSSHVAHTKGLGRTRGKLTAMLDNVV